MHKHTIAINIISKDDEVYEIYYKMGKLVGMFTKDSLEMAEDIASEAVRNAFGEWVKGHFG